MVADLVILISWISLVWTRTAFAGAILADQGPAGLNGP
jgi:hypothetical protein